VDGVGIGERAALITTTDIGEDGRILIDRRNHGIVLDRLFGRIGPGTTATGDTVPGDISRLVRGLDHRIVRRGDREIGPGPDRRIVRGSLQYSR
jgi:hypothetical protein